MITPVSQVSVNKVPFRAEAPVKNEEPKVVETKDNKMLYAGLAGLAVLGAAGIYIATRGKGAKPQIKTPDVQVPDVPEEIKNLKEMVLNTFKKYGKFEKGKASFNGKPYSGTITTPKSKFTYEDGNLVESELSNGIVKTYGYENGKVARVTAKHPDYEMFLCKSEDGSIKRGKRYWAKNERYVNGKAFVEERTLISPDKKVSRTKYESFNMVSPNYKKGKEMALERITDLNTGKVVVRKRVPDVAISKGHYKKHVDVDGKDVFVYCDFTGKCEPYSIPYHAAYNSETGVITKQFYKKMKDGKLVPSNKFAQMDKKTGAVVLYKVDENGQKVLDYFSDNQKYYKFYTCDPERIKSKIAEMGLKFDI